MPERKLIVNGLEIYYQGLFEIKGLLKKINDTIKQKGYIQHEKITEETVTTRGKNTYIEYRPIKHKTEFYDIALKIRIYLNNITDTKKTIDNKPYIYQQGEIRILLDAWTITDYEARWMMKPTYYLLKGVINKFIYKFPLPGGYIGELDNDTRKIHDEIKAYLDLFKYKTKQPPQPEEQEKIPETIETE